MRMAHQPISRKMRALAKTALPLLLVFSTATVLAGPALAQNNARDFRAGKIAITVETLADGLQNPWSVEALPDGAYLISERPGRLRLLRDGRLSQPLSGLPDISAGGQGGLLDIALDPQFGSNRTIYFTASIPGNGGRGTAVFRAVLTSDETRLDDVVKLFEMNRFTDAGQHFGSRIAIAPDGKLFFGIGDRGQGDRAQDLNDHAGKLMRIDADGKTPSDNPFVTSGRALPEIWSFGHRNPQGIAFDPKDGTLLTVEHGARGGDEINSPVAGSNYGWPVISYGTHYSGQSFPKGTTQDGMEQPTYYWDPSIAPGALTVYRGAMFPEWDGDILVAALKYQLLARLERDESGKILTEERMLEGEYGRIRDVVVAPDGAILLLTDETNGALLRISRTGS